MKGGEIMTPTEEKLLKNNERLLAQLEELTKQLDVANKKQELLQEEIAHLRHILTTQTRMLFGRKKESLSEGQTSLFDEAPFSQPEHTGQESQEEIEVLTYKRKKKSKGRKAAILDGLPENHIFYTLEGEDCLCGACGHELVAFAKEEVRREPLFIPAHVEVNVHHQTAYKCHHCEKTSGQSQIVKAKPPVPLIPNSLGSASIVADTIIEKFVKKVPAYRQEKLWATINFPINRDMITNWHILSVENALEPMFDLLHDKLQEQEVIHADETTYNVLESQKVKSYFWHYLSGKHEPQQIHLYQFEDTRGHHVPDQFLGNFHGYCHSDGYRAYFKIDRIKNVSCFSHVRRQFYEIVVNSSQKKGQAKVALDYCDKLFKLERKWKELSVEERKERRNKELKPVLDEFYQWMSNLPHLPKTKLGGAIAYAMNMREGIYKVLEDGRLELSNNRAERGIKELVMGRKNWLFSQSFKGAKAVGIIQSILQTARANGLNLRKYLIFLFEKIPNLPVLNQAALEAYLPWQPEIQEICS